MVFIPSPFGTGKDEQAMTDAFERLCGGVANAQRLFRCYKAATPLEGQTKADVFRKLAKKEGFDPRQIEALLELQ